jgi:hypothetical protein
MLVVEGDPTMDINVLAEPERNFVVTINNGTMEYGLSKETVNSIIIRDFAMSIAIDRSRMKGLDFLHTSVTATQHPIR